MSLYDSASPLEQAYAAYLVDQVFFGAYPISGRDAVPFLTSSGIARELLRELWQVVDPQGLGKLFQKQQWWTLLKLVALAQQYPLYSRVQLEFAMQHSQNTPLAVFINTPIPSADYLLQNYQSCIETINSVQVENHMDALSSALDAIAPAHDAPLPELGAVAAAVVVEQDDMNDDFGGFVAPIDSREAGNAPDALSSALDAVAPVHDAPLPEYGVAPAVAAPVVGQQIDFGFQGSRDASNASDPLLSSAFDGIAPVYDAPLPDLGAAAAANVIPEQGETNDDFGGFEAPQGSGDASNASDPLSSALDAIAPVHDAPLPVFGAAATAVVEPEQDDANDGFGGFEAPQGSGDASNASDPLSSSLDAIAPVHDAPLPDLGTAAAAANVVPENDVVDDDFGGFEAPQGSGEANNASDPLSSALDAIAPIHDAPLPDLGPTTNAIPEQDGTDDDEFGGFEAAQSSGDASNASDPLSSALDAIAPVHDAPLPDLGAANVVPEQDDSDDDFGGFVDAPQSSGDASNASDPLSSALDAIAPVQDAPLPTLGALEEPQAADAVEESDDFGCFEDAPMGSGDASNASDPLSSALDSIAPVRDAPLPTLGVVEEPQAAPDVVQEKDDFGDFEDAPMGSNDASNTSDTLSSALDAVAPAHDAPFPELGVTVPEQDNANDDFGGFVAPKESGDASNASDPLSLALDAIKPVHDAPLPTLGAVTEPPAADVVPEQDEFGGFEDAGSGDASNASDPLSSALDAIAPVHDAPLPTLGAAAEPPVVNAVPEEDEFGGFEDAPMGSGDANNASDPLSLALDAIAPVHDAPLPTLGAVVELPNVVQDDDTDDFGDFEDAPKSSGMDSHTDDPLPSTLNATAPVHDAPIPTSSSSSQLPTTDIIHGDDTDEFGGFEDAPSGSGDASNTSDPLSLALDSIAPIHDAPLPTLGTVGELPAKETMQDEADDFGDFEDAPKEAGKKSSGDPLSSALDAIAPVHDAPLPTLGAVEEPPATDVVPEADSFGDFEDAAKEADTQHSDDLFSSALNGIAPDHDAPLPPLGGVLPAEDAQEDKISGFGDFESGNKEDSGVPFPTLFDAVDRAQELPTSENLPANASAVGLQEHGEDDFGNFEDAPKGPEEIGGNVDESSNGTERSAPALDDLEPEPDIAEEEQRGTADSDDSQAALNEPTIATESNDPFASAFDALTPVKNAPLPPLSSFAATDGAAKEADVIDDGFGDFNAPEALISNEAEPAALVFDESNPPPSALEVDRVESSNNEDFFGDFENAQQEATASSETETIDPFTSASDAVAPATDEQLWPVETDFTLPAPAVHDRASSNDVNEDGGGDESFGDFEDAFQAPSETRAAPEITGSESIENHPPKVTVDSDIFRTDAPLKHKSETALKAAPDTANEDSFGDFEHGAAPDTNISEPQASDDDDFGAFEDARESEVEESSEGTPKEEPEGDVQPRELDNVSTATDHTPDAAEDDDFGDFEGIEVPFEDATKSAPPQEEPPTEETTDDFGDFTTVEMPKDNEAFDTDWGDFASTANDAEVPAREVVAADPTEAAAKQAVNVSFGSFAESTNEPIVEPEDEFGNVEVYEPGKPIEEMTMEELRDHLKEMEKKLGRSKLVTPNGKKINFTKSFESHIMGIKTPGWRLSFKHSSNKAKAARKLLQGRRCCQVMSLLISTHSNSPANWEKIVSVARDELAMGSFLLEEAKNLNDSERPLIQPALTTLIKGLGEYVRVIRSIAATIGDLLCIDAKKEITEWDVSMSLLDSIREVEELWRGISSGVQLPSIKDIRTRCLDGFSDNSLCQLTLQPLFAQDLGTTLSPVEWNGKMFMACAANLWCNRISTPV